MTQPALYQTDLKGLKLLNRGKVRDIYDLGEHLLIVATDRISAFDVIMPNPIPGKGEVLTKLSEFWFRTDGRHHRQPSRHDGRGEVPRRMQASPRCPEGPEHAREEGEAPSRGVHRSRLHQRIGLEGLHKRQARVGNQPPRRV